MNKAFPFFQTLTALACAVSAAAPDHFKTSLTLSEKGRMSGRLPEWKLMNEGNPITAVPAQTLPFSVTCPAPAQTKSKLNGCSVHFQIQWIRPDPHLKWNSHVVLIGQRKGKWAVADWATSLESDCRVSLIVRETEKIVGETSQSRSGKVHDEAV